MQAYLDDLIAEGLPAPAGPRAHRRDRSPRSPATSATSSPRWSPRAGCKTIKHGAAILATGADEYKPTEYLYGQDERVLTQLELEERIADGRREARCEAQSLVMIQCVGCRQDDRNYCARVCCSQAIKNALEARRRSSPKMDIYVLFRDMRTYGFREDFYREAADRDVKFIRCEPEDKPAVEAADEEGRPVLRVTVPDPILGQRLASTPTCSSSPPRSSPRRAARRSPDCSRCRSTRTASSRKPTSSCARSTSPPTACSSAGRRTIPSTSPRPSARPTAPPAGPLTLLSHDTVIASGSVCAVDEERVRLLRGLHHGLHLRRDRVARDAARRQGRGQPRPVQGRRPVQRQVSHQRHRPEALHRRRGVGPDRCGAWRTACGSSRAQWQSLATEEQGG